MINTQAELIKVLEYMEKNQPRSTWAGILLQGGTYMLVFSIN